MRKILLENKVCGFESYRSVGTAHIGPPTDRYTDRPLPGDTLDLAPYRTIRGCFRHVTARNKSVTFDFNHHCSLPGGVSLATTREEAKKKKEKEGEEEGEPRTMPPSNSEAAARLLSRNQVSPYRSVPTYRDLVGTVRVVRIPVNHRTDTYRPYRAVQGGTENLAQNKTCIK
ncbi:hypothetical protein GW17_00024029 [Ensete ventricosum]|nr:hypothetical protein GW17_00024029 [Ensete ventricosum]